MNKTIGPQSPACSIEVVIASRLPNQESTSRRPARNLKSVIRTIANKKIPISFFMTTSCLGAQADEIIDSFIKFLVQLFIGERSGRLVKWIKERHGFHILKDASSCLTGICCESS